MFSSYASKLFHLKYPGMTDTDYRAYNIWFKRKALYIEQFNSFIFLNLLRLIAPEHFHTVSLRTFYVRLFNRAFFVPAFWGALRHGA